jgi:hypothetical protein
MVRPIPQVIERVTLFDAVFSPGVPVLLHYKSLTIVYIIMSRVDAQLLIQYFKLMTSPGFERGVIHHCIWCLVTWNSSQTVDIGNTWFVSVSHMGIAWCFAWEIPIMIANDEHQVLRWSNHMEQLASEFKCWPETLATWLLSLKHYVMSNPFIAQWCNPTKCMYDGPEHAWLSGFPCHNSTN